LTRLQSRQDCASKRRHLLDQEEGGNRRGRVLGHLCEGELVKVALYVDEDGELVEKDVA
jgi:hypothetical protein